jgi:hypothetical protein
MRGTFSFAPPGLRLFSLPTHGLRRGLYSSAASRLRCGPLLTAARPTLKRGQLLCEANSHCCRAQNPRHSAGATSPTIFCGGWPGKRRRMFTRTQLLGSRPDQIGKLTQFSNSCLQFFSFICYKQSTESRSVAAGRSLFESLVSARHLRFKRVKSPQSSRPRDLIRKHLVGF